MRHKKAGREKKVRRMYSLLVEHIEPICHVLECLSDCSVISETKQRVRLQVREVERLVYETRLCAYLSDGWCVADTILESFPVPVDHVKVIPK